MYRINASEASREELIEIVKQLRQQLRQRQAGSARIKELEDQVTQLQKDLQEKENEVKALKRQSELLSEKSAEDEETISVLIKQLEELSSGDMKTAVGSDDVKVARVIPMTTTSTHPKKKVTASLKASQSSPKITSSSGLPIPGTTIGEAVNDNVSSSSAIIARQNEEMAKLEMKVRELMEVNTFYTAIVSHHDEEERLRTIENHNKSGEGVNASDHIDVVLFQTRISTLESERDTLQQMLYQQKHENHNLMKELQELREELSHLELDLVDAERWRGERVATSMTSSVPIPQISTAFSSHRDDESPPTRILAQYVVPIEYKGGEGGKLMPKRPIRNYSTSSLAEGSSPSRRGPVSSSRTTLDLDSLPEIRLWYPSKQEKMLSERLEMYRKRIEEMQAYEADRQRSFDEIERNRAELFTEMNLKLEENRREIQRLKKRLAGISNESPKKKAKTSEGQHRMVNASTSPMVIELHEEEDVRTKYFGTLSLAETGEQQTIGEEEGIRAHANGDLEEPINHMSNDDVNEEEKLLQKLLDATSTPPGTPSVNQLLLCSNENDSDEKEESVVLESGQIGHLNNDSSSFKGKKQSLWELIALAEENERIAFIREEGEEIIRILLWSRIDMTTIVENATKRAVDSAKEVEVITNSLLEMREKLSLLSEQKHELEAEVERLQGSIVSLKQREVTNDREKREAEVVALSATQKLESIFTLEETWARDRLEPLQYVCQAYAEVVDAQVELLRVVSVDHSKSVAALSNDEYKRISDALDAIHIGTNDSFQVENKNKEMKSITTSSELPEVKTVDTNAKEVSLSLNMASSLSSPAPLQKYPNCDLSSSEEVCGNDLNDAMNASSGTPIKDSPSSQMMTPQMQSDENTLDKSRDRLSTVVKKENDRSAVPTQKVGVGGSSSWNTPSSSFFLGEHTDISNSITAPITYSKPHLASESGKEFLLDPLLYFMTNKETTGKKEPRVVIEERASEENKTHDFFTSALPSTQPITKQGGESQGFVAEFDPFA
ncbi:uncharacterized protein TM35_000131930 [Trypanosoma theileri]|uniref:Uncharacterized protein n=1 Tax=Trypanosoma theileri TaxID=67003 RepID=A0A1X0NY90_9TRYP|nr:uncharacterized protein TM35_000131930 [Trypanosoma theileri]ORC89189.1 hypothetical protein TM35_000131930 [Trypanosoma theileri]